MLQVDPYLFPARGRKPPHSQTGQYVVDEVDPYLFPARGRKQSFIVWIWFPQVLTPTFSPQGDGNLVSVGAKSASHPVLTPTFSPQGDGNVEPVTYEYDTFHMLTPTFSPQGDGNQPIVAHAGGYFIKR